MSTQPNTTEQLVFLDPSEIAFGDNVRFANKPHQIERLAEQILQDGGVNTPIEVQELETPTEDGKKYLLTVGTHRTAAVAKLNSEQNAGLKLPARVVPLENEVQRTIRQVSENKERANLSPMDTAVAIKRLKDAGVPQPELMKIFAAPGGRKGIKFQPASNSYINNTLAFLDFPKAIQNKIDSGMLGTGAAYELLRYPKDEWQKILDKAEKDRLDAIDSEDKAEEKFLKDEKAAQELEAKLKEHDSGISTVKETAEKAAKVAKEKAAELEAAFKATRATGLSKEDREKAEKHFRSMKAEEKSAQDVAAKAAKELAKAEEKASNNAEKVAKIKERLEKLRANSRPSVKKVAGKDDVRKAAKESGVAPVKESTKAKPLNLNEAKDAIKTLTILGAGPKTKSVGLVILECLAGKVTDGQLNLAIGRLTGEVPEAENPAPPAAPAPKAKGAKK